MNNKRLKSILESLTGEVLETKGGEQVVIIRTKDMGWNGIRVWFRTIGKLTLKGTEQITAISGIRFLGILRGQDARI